MEVVFYFKNSNSIILNICLSFLHYFDISICIFSSHINLKDGNEKRAKGDKIKKEKLF